MNAFLCPLASGSLGNALLVVSSRARLLVDMGLSRRRTAARLRAVGVEPDMIDALLVTHTHGDHFSSAAPGFCAAHGIRVFSTEANLEHLAGSMRRFRKLDRAGLPEPLDGDTVTIGDITIEPFPVPHDSPGECLGFRLTMGPARRRRVVTVATDLGHVPDACLGWFVDSHAVVLESNHDPEMLAASGRPADLIHRIAGPNGHLSNGDSAEALSEIVGRSRRGRVKDMILAHLSRECNTPEIALETHACLASHGAGSVRFSAASQFEPGPMVLL